MFARFWMEIDIGNQACKIFNGKDFKNQGQRAAEWHTYLYLKSWIYSLVSPVVNSLFKLKDIRW
jgi:hypothetical protein